MPKLQPRAGALLSASCALFVVGCRDTTAPRMAVVRLSTHAVAIGVGGSAQLTLSAPPSAYVPAVTWSSSDSATATVQNTGSGVALVHGLRVGEATIRVSGGGAGDSAVVTVVSLTPPEQYLGTLSIYVGQRATITPEHATGEYGIRYDSVPVMTSPGVVFVGLDSMPAYTPQGPAGELHVYHFLAEAPGRAVVTIRDASGKAALQDTISVEAAVPHGAFAQVSTGFFLNTCGVTTGGVGFCWGANAGGGLGAGATNDFSQAARPIYDTPMPVAAQLAFRVISVGGGHTCGVTTGGAAYCWGSNFNGQLGNGDTLPSLVPRPVVGGLTFKSVSAGSLHTCGLTTTGAIYCWGNDYDGEIGNPAAVTYDNTTPLRVASDSTFVAVGAGFQFSCGLTGGGAVLCWGLNQYGELGTGDTVSAAVPVPVAGGRSFAALSLGYFHACALDRHGAAFCWGANSAGELGDGTTDQATTPAAVSGRLTFAAISAGQWATCGATTTGAGYCWGYNGYGQLGSAAIPLTDQPNPRPVPVGGGFTFSTITTGYYHTCGITPQGTAYCWGDNSEGELGDGSTTIHPTPVPVLGP